MANKKNLIITSKWCGVLSSWCYSNIWWIV